MASCRVAWRAIILEAIAAGLDVLSGIAHVPRRRPGVRRGRQRLHGTRIVDYRRPPDRMETSVGRLHGPGKRVLLTVGTDCAIGKMSVALSLRAAAVAAGDSAVFVPTGQTGMMIDGWGVAVDRLIADFAQGTVEWMVEQAEAQGDWVLVEGQGSLDHPAYSAVTLALIHGATPQGMILVHKPGTTEHDFDHLPDVSFPIASLPGFIRIHEQVAGPRGAVDGRGDRAQHVALPGRRRRRGESSPRSRPRRDCRPRIRSGSGPTACGPPSGERMLELVP